MTPERIIADAREYAIGAHANVNHFYDGRPYSVHLAAVVGTAERYIEKYFSNRFGYSSIDRAEIIAACWLHDTIEDTRKTYNDIRGRFGENIAETVFALTNEKGRTRKDRANAKYYAGIKEDRVSLFVKLCDRIANASYEVGGRMWNVYRDEHESFEVHLVTNDFREMWEELWQILDIRGLIKELSNTKPF